MALSLEDINKRAIQQRAAGRRKPMTAEERFEAEQTVQSITNTINYFSDIYSKWDKKTEQTEQQYLSGEITNPEAVLRDWAATINAVFTPVSDATGAVLSAADEALLSGAGGKGLEAAGEYLSETDAGQAVIQYIQENPRAAENIMAAVDVAGVIPIARIVKSGINMPAAELQTKLEGFYGPGVGSASKGVAAGKGLMKAVPSAIINAFNPKAIAYERVTGLPKGKIRDISKTHEYEDGKLVPRARGDRIGAAKAMENIAIQRGAEPGTTAVGKSPLAVADTIELIPAPNKEAVSQQLFSKGVNVGYDVPDAVKNKHLDHVYKVWGFNENNTDIQIKNPEGPVSGLAYEARLGQSSTVPRAVALKALDQKKVTLVSKKNPNDNIEAKGLSEWTKKDVAKLNTADIKAYYRYLNEELKKAGEDKRFRLEDNDDGFLHISDSHGSREKELGGVNDMISIHPESGEVFVTISDAHDMFGFNPIGGRGLVAVTPPQRSNFKKHAEDAPLREKVANLEKQIKSIDKEITKLKKELPPVPRTKTGTQAGKKTKAYEDWEKINKEKLDRIEELKTAKQDYNDVISTTKDKYKVFDKTDNLNKEKILAEMEEKAASFEKEFGIPRKEKENAVTYTMRALGEIDPKANIKDYLTLSRRAGMLTSATQSTLGAEQEEQNY